MLEIWLSWWRDLMLMREGVKDWVLNRDYAEDLEEWNQSYTSRQITEFIGAIAKTVQALDHNVNARLRP